MGVLVNSVDVILAGWSFYTFAAVYFSLEDDLCDDDCLMSEGNTLSCGDDCTLLRGDIIYMGVGTYVGLLIAALFGLSERHKNYFFTTVSLLILPFPDVALGCVSSEYDIAMMAFSSGLTIIGPYAVTILMIFLDMEKTFDAIVMAASVVARLMIAKIFVTHESDLDTISLVSMGYSLGMCLGHGVRLKTLEVERLYVRSRCILLLSSVFVLVGVALSVSKFEPCSEPDWSKYGIMLLVSGVVCYLSQLQGKYFEREYGRIRWIHLITALNAPLSDEDGDTGTEMEMDMVIN
jgi:uncharacterized membrane protein (GlpM family)